MAIQTLTLNVNAQPSAEDRAFLYLSQNENGRDIRFRVLGDDLPSGCTATLSGVKPDGNVWSKAGTVTNNFVVVEEDIQMTAVAGRWDAQLDIVNGSKNIVTALIRITVEAAAVEAGAVPSDTQLEGYVEQCKQYAETAKDEAYGSPLTASTAAAMTDQKRVYVYTGSETGYTAGHWYYHNGTSWTDGGVYNAVAVDTDTTLSVSGKAADAKKTGDELSTIKEDFTDIENDIYISSSVAYDWTALGTTTYPYNFRPGYIGSDGNVGSNSTTAKKHLRNNKTIRFNADTVTITPPTGYYVAHIAEYTSNVISSDNFVSKIYSGSDVDTPVTFTNVPDHYFVIVIGLFADDSTNYYQDVTFLATILAVQNATISRIDRCDAIVPFVHPIVRVSKTDGSADFDTISEAIAYANNNPYTTILVDSGNYDIIEELGGSTYTENLSGLSSYAGGLMLGNNTTIIGMGSGAKLTANYTAGTNQVMTDRFSIFNIVGSFRLENIEMEVTNVRYCVHEDMGALDSSSRPDFYTAEYISCKMRHNGTVSNTFAVASCIGGGTMNKSHHIVDGCYLESPSGKNPIGYHNNSTRNEGVARVQMRNCYLANNGTLTLTVYNSNTQVIDAEICGNRLGNSNIDRSNGLYTVKAWNNVVE